jgi:hypothetical protein
LDSHEDRDAKSHDRDEKSVIESPKGMMESINLSQLLVRLAIAQAMFENNRHNVCHFLDSSIHGNNYICCLIHGQEGSNQLDTLTYNPQTGPVDQPQFLACAQ